MVFHQSKALGLDISEFKTKALLVDLCEQGADWDYPKLFLMKAKTC